MGHSIRVDFIATQPKSSHPNGPHRKKRPSLLEYSDDEDEDDVEEEGPSAIGCDTELQLYIDSPKSDSVLRLWETKKDRSCTTLRNLPQGVLRSSYHRRCWTVIQHFRFYFEQQTSPFN